MRDRLKYSIQAVMQLESTERSNKHGSSPSHSDLFEVARGLLFEY